MNLADYKKYEPIYVIGHSHIDIDSAVSSKILSELFNYYGVKSYYAVLDKNYTPDPYNKGMIDACMKFEPVVIKEEDVSKYNWFLTDHNDRVQSVGENANIIGSIDHHPDANNIENDHYTNICSVSLYLFEEYKNKYKFSEEQKYQIYLAFLNDSTFGRSSRFKESDSMIASQLGFGSDYETLFKKFFIPTDTSVDDSELLKYGHKSYDFEDVHFNSGHIEAFGIEGLERYKKLTKKQESYLGIWIDYTNNNTYAYFNYDNKFVSFEYDYVASRATTILNDVLDYLKKNNYL